MERAWSLLSGNWASESWEQGQGPEAMLLRSLPLHTGSWSGVVTVGNTAWGGCCLVSEGGVNSGNFNQRFQEPLNSGWKGLRGI